MAAPNPIEVLSPSAASEASKVASLNSPEVPVTPVAAAMLEEPKEEEKPKTRADVVASEGVSQSIYLSWIKKELDDENACLELPFTITMVISFSILAILHLGQAKVFTVEEAIENDIIENANFAWAHAFGHKGIEDANSIGDFWSWFRLGFLPLVVQPDWYYAEALEGTDKLPSSWKFPEYVRPAPITGDYLRYNRVVSGIRVRQEVAEASMELCRFPGNFDLEAQQEWYGKPCAPSDTGMLPAELPDAESSFPAERTQWFFPALDDMDTLLSTAVDMEDGCSQLEAKNRTKCLCDWCGKQNPNQPWLDEQTTRVEISFVCFNAQYGLHMLIGVNFFFNRAGHMYKFVNAQSAWGDPFAQPIGEVILMLVADFIWIFANLKVLIGESQEVIGVIRGSKEKWYKSLQDDYLGPWNMVDWIAMMIAFIIVMLYFFMFIEVQSVNDAFVEIMNLHLGKAARDLYQEAAISLFDKVQVMCTAERRFRMTLCLYPWIIMMRLFKSFSAQPRLAVVTSTLEVAGQDLLHFFIVFMSIYVCMTVNSILFFGQDVEEFATFDRALHNCFRALFGDWDYDAMQQIGRFQAGIWFWLFLMIMVIILLNMLLAIVMDSYAAVKEGTADAQTLMDQINEMVRRRRQFVRGERVRLTDVWNWFEEDAGGDVKALLANERKITPQFLEDNVPKMKLKQAKRTLENALREKEEEEMVATSEIDLKDPIESISKKVQIIQADVNYMRERIDYYDKLDIPPDEYKHFCGGGGLGEEALFSEVSQAVSDLSTEMATMLGTQMARLERRQEDLEQQQDQMHAMLNEMKGMLLQQVRVMSDISQSTKAMVLSPRSLLN